MNGLFTAMGAEAKASAQKKNVDFKTAYIRLKEGESVRVRLLGLTDYVEYQAQGDFNLGIYTQPMIDGVIGKQSPLTIAAASGIEGFEKLKAKKRYIFAFYDLDMKQVRYFDASKPQATKLIGDIEEYKENIVSEDPSELIAFTFKRTGQKTETVYSLNPILKMKPEVQEVFDAAAEVKVTPEDFGSVISPRTEEQQIEALKAAGFPVADFFEVKTEDALPSEFVEADPTGDF